MKRLSFITISVLAGLLTCGTAIAQNKAALKTIADKMFAEGDLHFVLVEAYNDELLYEGQSYDFAYKNGVVTINEQPLPAAFTQKYALMIRSFHKGDEKSTFSLRGGGMTLAEILDPESSFRTSHANMERHRTKAMRDEIANAQMLNEMTRDGLIDTTAGYNISYNNKGFYINGKKLEGKQYRKYVDMYVMAGGREPVTDKDGSFTMVKGTEPRK